MAVPANVGVNYSIRFSVEEQASLEHLLHLEKLRQKASIVAAALLTKSTLMEVVYLAGSQNLMNLRPS